MGADRVAKAEPGDVDGLLFRGKLWSGAGCRRGSRSASPSCRLPAPASRSTSKVIGLPALAKHRLGQPHRVEVVLPVDLDDPVSLAETGRFGGRIFADAADRLDLQPEAEVDKMVGGQSQLELLESPGRASPDGEIGRRSITCLIGCVGVPGEQAIVLERRRSGGIGSSPTGPAATRTSTFDSRSLSSSP